MMEKFSGFTPGKIRRYAQQPVGEELPPGGEEEMDREPPAEGEGDEAPTEEGVGDVPEKKPDSLLWDKPIDGLWTIPIENLEDNLNAPLEKWGFAGN